MKTNKPITKLTLIFSILLLIQSVFISKLTTVNNVLANESMSNDSLKEEITLLKNEIRALENELKQAKEKELINAYELTQEEREIIERVVAAEARGETLKGQMAVANVIKDRAELWNMTPTEVVTAKGQFAEPFQGEISEDTKLAVEIIFDKGIRVFKEPVTHFASNNPWWAEHKAIIGKIGVHTFYY
jgi:spore germination cell wall hydrolase CwlJ-like protein